MTVNHLLILLQAFSGRDASQAFISYHRRNFPHSRAKPAFEGIDESVDYTPEDHADYMELCERVGKVSYLHPVWFITDTSNFSLVRPLEFPYMVHATSLIYGLHESVIALPL